MIKYLIYFLLNSVSFFFMFSFALSNDGSLEKASALFAIALGGYLSYIILREYIIRKKMKRREALFSSMSCFLLIGSGYILFHMPSISNIITEYCFFIFIPNIGLIFVALLIFNKKLWRSIISWFFYGVVIFNNILFFTLFISQNALSVNNSLFLKSIALVSLFIFLTGFIVYFNFSNTPTSEKEELIKY